MSKTIYRVIAEMSTHFMTHLLQITPQYGYLFLYDTV
jgi:hypothetical protein